MPKRLVIAVVLTSAGCVSYGPGEIQSMSTYEICEAQSRAAWSIRDSSRQQLSTELERRNENCAPHAAYLKALRDDELYDRMYRNQSP